MRCKFVTMSVGLAASALASLGLVPANAKSEATNHDAAIKACSTVNPSQPVKVVNAVEDAPRLQPGLAQRRGRQSLDVRRP
jgi:hypothetical protein